MKRFGKALLAGVAVATLLSGCAEKAERVHLSVEEKELAAEVGISEQQYSFIKESQLYELSPRQTDQYLRVLHKLEPDLRKRIGLIAEKNIGQPYELYLLGEGPVEPYDAQPLFELGKSDCVVFVEHTYAMGLSDNWSDFFTTLQHLRYKHGEVGVVTRNHYTEYDWNRNNAWLVEDISGVVGEEVTERYQQVINKERFFASRFGIDVPAENVSVDEVYIGNEHIAQISPHLQTGDFVNFVRGNSDNAWISHVGIIKVEEDGKVNVIHSTSPAVRKEGLLEMAQESVEAQAERLARGKSAILGYKFLRLRESPMANLAAKFDGTIPPVTMSSRKHMYLTDQQVEQKLQRMKVQILAERSASEEAEAELYASE
uniref:N-acetylmuramoyl-L-alanine amidase-like domain-containing protein n=1 Tax=Microbulbifer agarilyticus TaxID=260552 RepID=UPI000255BAE8|nr:N-acetylmuramoyl-L-alanine amidase-like domain-containing protein [Microbulbifer agarilyticus]